MPIYSTGGGMGVVPSGREEFVSSTFESVQAAAADAWAGNPTTVAWDWAKQRQANIGERLTVDDAQARVKDAGVKLDIPAASYTPEALDMLISRKQDELARQERLSRAPSGFFAGGARLTASLATSIVDPLNIASAFVPVVGEARAAAILARAGASVGRRAMARASIGAVEGVAGAALLEPLVYLGRTQLQDDYGMSDSLLNLAFGGIVGGGLHVGVGAFADKFSIKPAAGLDAGIKDMPEPVIDKPAAFDSAINTRAGRFDIRRNEEPVTEHIEMGDEGVTQAQGARVEYAAYDGDTQIATVAFREQPDGTYIPEHVEVAETHRRQGVATSLYDQAARDGLTLAPSPNLSEVGAKYQDAYFNRVNQRAQTAEGVVTTAAPEQREAAARIAVAQMVSGRMPDVEGIYRGDSFEQMRSTGNKMIEVEEVSLADFEAAATAGARMEESPLNLDVERAEAAQVEADDFLDSMVRTLENAGQDTAEIRAAMKPFDDAVQDAENIRNALRAAATCEIA